jgi:hypothetical protein
MWCVVVILVVVAVVLIVERSMCDHGRAIWYDRGSHYERQCKQCIGGDMLIIKDLNTKMINGRVYRNIESPVENSCGGCVFDGDTANQHFVCDELQPKCRVDRIWVEVK